MFSQAVTNQVGQQKGARQGEPNTSRIHEFFRMNPPSFIGSKTSEDPENFANELKKVFDVMHVADTERKQKGPTSSSTSEPAPKNKDEYNGQNFRAKPTYSQGSVTQGGSKPPACAKCGRNHSVAPLDRVTTRGATFGTGGGTNRLYAIIVAKRKRIRQVLSLV
ncbi:uncharacterized protein LOC125857369 [Solanum stenotomum]|uniref:uncharacterized protein LOC125857369 n=1 Tax=Solanum stenotomum TaxID=172797 RepID=UPI0020D10B6A|nr:uncharacterized protein LOC125857369 [Solanum stenotomum]